MRSAALIAVAILAAGFLIAYHPHPFGWGDPAPSGGGGSYVPTYGDSQAPGYGP